METTTGRLSAPSLSLKTAVAQLQEQKLVPFPDPNLPTVYNDCHNTNHSLGMHVDQGMAQIMPGIPQKLKQIRDVTPFGRFPHGWQTRSPGRPVVLEPYIDGYVSSPET
uniref:Uncharacterized protein n=1 Tax=Eutreptiella gymnastica TaxID=73025 RepID=A0A7S1NPL8_9EUGL|mmetsp:Transcript_68446/g.121100  ORF Transcript_68446/g.121100 Transcript_68446/m.121100 type:complete len:109 (+) Transcript_68446:2514-2840(+)